jgi:glycosyltransferase involved in cell wall biosynthesis
MKVSVVIPVFNKAPFLQECLDSVFTQTLTDLEVIAVDDRSSDDSLAILNACTDPRLRVVALPDNRGPAGAVRVAMDLAQGEYIIRVDADDVSLPDRFAEQVRFMDERPDLGISGTRVVDHGDPTLEFPVPLSREACMATMFFTVPIQQPTAIYRRSVLEAYDLRFDPEWPRIGEDWLFYIKAGRVTTMANLDRVLVRYRTGAQNISHGQDMVKRWTDALQVGLPMMGLEPTEENIRFHLLTKPAFTCYPDRALLRGFKEWSERLKREGGVVERKYEPAFAKALDAAWDRLFARLCDHGLAPALDHMRIGGGWSMQRMIYLLKVRIRALMNGGRGGAGRTKGRS